MIADSTLVAIEPSTPSTIAKPSTPLALAPPASPTLPPTSLASPTPSLASPPSLVILRVTQHLSKIDEHLV